MVFTGPNTYQKMVALIIIQQERLKSQPGIAAGDTPQGVVLPPIELTWSPY
jgi:hypothetical protein